MFFMGHKGDIEARYTTNKGKLPQDLIEDMRRAFMESGEYLETRSRPEKDKKETLLEMWRDQAKLYGVDPMKIEKERKLGQELTVDDEILELKIEIQRHISQLTAAGNENGNKPYTSKLVMEEDLGSHIEEG